MTAAATPTTKAMGAGQPGPSTATRSNGPKVPSEAKRMAV